MISILTIIFFALGLIIGSFLNVVVFRFNTNRTFRGRSGCMTCQSILSPKDLVPVFSFLFLKGRCRNCKSRISIQYPIVEFVTGVIFASLFLKFQDVFFMDTLAFSITYAYYVTMFSVLLVVAVYDLRHKIIPDSLSFVFSIITFIGLFFFANYQFYPHIPTILELASGVLLSLPFALVWFLSRGAWMGLGDAKLSLGLGWLLGFSRILSGAVVAFWSGAIIGLLLILFSKKHNIKSEIPFAPFLVLGVLVAFLFELTLFPVGF